MAGSVRNSPVRRRRTQAERTAETRAKLVDATIECLVELGYDATTGAAVSERAGVSRGAETHHFPRRLDLIVGAVDEIAQRRIEQLGRELNALPAGRRRVRGALDLLWKVYMGPLTIAGTKLWVAADDDLELRARMIPAERDASLAFRRQLREHLGPADHRADFDWRLTVAVNTVRGLALVMCFEPVDYERPDPWPYHRRVLERLLTD